jgi:ribosomal protein S12 methylthiotransferase accessory factor
MTLPNNIHSIHRYKAVEPEKTIHAIREILFSNNIFVIEFSWVREENRFTSLGLGMADLPLTCAGKGINERYALASAYGEFLERFQNLFLINANLRAGKHQVGDILFSDAVAFDYELFKKKHFDILRHLFIFDDFSQLDEIFSKCELPLHSYPYYNVTKASIEYLPYELLLLSLGTNGMCSGNTIEEALIQGLCEIFERFAFRAIYETNGISFPVVPDDYMKDLPQWSYIEFLRSNGFEVFVKDCSLDGTLPVAGVLIVKDGKAQFNLGASPDFSIAVERCFTEMFQGCDLKLIKNKLKPVAPLDSENVDRYLSDKHRRLQYQYYLSLTSAAGIVHPAVFDHSRPFHPGKLFQSDSLISKDCLRAMLEVVHKSGHEVYVRDVSFLGFPAYQVYIPGMSEVMKRNCTELRWRFHDLPRARKTFYSLNKCSQEDLLSLIKAVENILDYPYTDKETLFQKVHNLHLRGNVILNNVDLENVLALLHFKSGNVASAHRVLEGYIKRKLNTEQFYNPPEFALDHFCLLRFFESLTEGHSLEEARDILMKEYRGETVDQIYHALKELSRLTAYLGIPACEDCDFCEYRHVCSYDSLRHLAERMQRHINDQHFDHLQVGSYLQTLMER